MNRKNQLREEAFDRTILYGTIYPLTLAVPRATALFAELTTTTTKLRELGVDQINGQTTFRGAVDGRMSLRDQLIESLREINKIARALDKDAFPTARENFRMPASFAYVNLVAAARSFAEHAEEMTALFTERGRPATFVEDLETLATTVENAAAPRSEGRVDQVGATAGIEVHARKGVAILRELDSIISPPVKDDAVQLARWKAAVEIQRPRTSTPAEEPPAGSGTTTPPPILPLPEVS